MAKGSRGPFPVPRQHRFLLKRENPATWELQGQAGQGEPGRKGPAGAGSLSPPQQPGASPSRDEGVKIQALSGLKRWMGSGEGKGTHKGTVAQNSLCLCSAEWAFSLPGGEM